MTINISVPEPAELHPRITVIGVGGAGGNAVNNMIDAQLGGVDFVVLNTDSQSLAQSLTDRRIQLGVNVTQGLGAGSNPEVGRRAAEESLPEIMEMLSGSHMVFITAGMGGGTGSGASPLIAQAAREAGILTVGVVTKPFQFEGAHRMAIAESGTKSLENCVDTLITIPNQNLFRVANDKTTFADAFKMADDVLYSGVRSVTDLMVMPGLINLDFADVRSIMMEMGKAMMGTGEADGDRRAIDAAEAAIANPLLDDVSMKGAKGVLINITGGPDMTLYEVDEAANRIRDEVDEDANIIFGSIFDPEITGHLRVSVVATGIEREESEIPRVHTLYTSHSNSISDRKINQEIKSQESYGMAKQPSQEYLNTGVSSVVAPKLGEGVTIAQKQFEDASIDSPVNKAIVESSNDFVKTEVVEKRVVESVAENNLQLHNQENLASVHSTPAYSSKPVIGNVALETAVEEEIESFSDNKANIENKLVVEDEESFGKTDVKTRPVLEDEEKSNKEESNYFIPPAPVKTSTSKESFKKPEPFAEAAVANASESPKDKKPKNSSLFERMSNVALQKKETYKSSFTFEKATKKDNEADFAKVEPSFSSEENLNLTEKNMSDEKLNLPKNQGLIYNSTNLDTSTELSQSSNITEQELVPEPSKELLDIPAFLRRQAN